MIAAGLGVWHNARAGDRDPKPIAFTTATEPAQPAREVVLTAENPSMPIDLSSGKHVLEIAGPGENQSGPIVVRVRPAKVETTTR